MKVKIIFPWINNLTKTVTRTVTARLHKQLYSGKSGDLATLTTWYMICIEKSGCNFFYQLIAIIDEHLSCDYQFITCKQAPSWV